MSQTIDNFIEINFPIEEKEIAYAIKLILNEMVRAKNEHPVFPKDVVHIAAVVSEEAGEVVKAANHCYESKGLIYDVESELQHTAATCIRAMVAITSKKYIVNDSR